MKLEAEPESYVMLLIHVIDSPSSLEPDMDSRIP